MVCMYVCMHVECNVLDIAKPRALETKAKGARNGEESSILEALRNPKPV